MKLKSDLAVAVDVMGGDNAPHAIIEGAIAAARIDGLASLLVGQEPLIKKIISDSKAQNLIDTGLLRIKHASETIGMEDKAGESARSKRDSSMKIACDLVKEGQACGVLSAGNSGAMMAVSMLSLGRIKGVLRPAIGAIMPNANNFTLVIDAGANIECDPEYLLQFALMGSVYMRVVHGLASPKVAVLSNGEEESKGTKLTKTALSLIKQSDVNCLGYCEGRDVLSGIVDVVVCDGFNGNVLLKTAEGTAAFLMSQIKSAYHSHGLIPKLGAFLSRPVFNTLKKRIDPREFGAAPLLGLNFPALIAHGSSDSYAIQRAIGRVKEQSSLFLADEISRVLSS